MKTINPDIEQLRKIFERREVIIENETLIFEGNWSSTLMALINTSCNINRISG